MGRDLNEENVAQEVTFEALRLSQCVAEEDEIQDDDEYHRILWEIENGGSYTLAQVRAALYYLIMYKIRRHKDVELWKFDILALLNAEQRKGATQ